MTQTISMAAGATEYSKPARSSGRTDAESLFGSMLGSMKTEGRESKTKLARSGSSEPDGQTEALAEASTEAPVDGLSDEPREEPAEKPREKTRGEDMIMIFPDAVLSALRNARNEQRTVSGDTTETAAVFILEGTKEKAAPERAQTAETKQPADGAAARMPQGTPVGQSAASTGAAGADSCPLENENGGAASDFAQAEQSSVAEQGSAVDPDSAANATSAEATSAEAVSAEAVSAETEAEKKLKTESAAEQPVNQLIDVSPEKISSDVQLRSAAETADAPAVGTNNLFDTMVERVEMLQQAETSKMTIQLRPEFLGKVSLEMTMNEGVMQVKISAEDAEVKSMIGGQIGALIETLAGRGIKVADVEVVYTGVPSGNLADSQSGGHGASRDGRASGSGRIESPGGYDFGMDIADAATEPSDPELSSVEYRA